MSTVRFGATLTFVPDANVSVPMALVWTRFAQFAMYKQIPKHCAQPVTAFTKVGPAILQMPDKRINITSRHNHLTSSSP